MKLHSALLYCLVGTAIFGAILILDQIWLQSLSWEVFIKLLITLAIVAVLAVFLMLVRADLAQNRKLKDENYLD